MKMTPFRILLVLAVLISASLACNLPVSQNSTVPTQELLDQEELEQLENQLQETLEDPQTDEVSVTLTQEQLTTYLAEELARQDEPILTDPVVVLTNGQMEVYGKVSQSGLRANAKAVLQPRIGADGNPELDIVSMDLGPFPVPGPIRNQFETMADNSLNQYLAEYSDQFRVTDITILDGQMAITGVRP